MSDVLPPPGSHWTQHSSWGGARPTASPAASDDPQLLPTHPNATPAVVLGVLGVLGAVVCLGFFAPLAWWLGARSVRQIDADPATYGGRGKANAGRILGIVGTALFVLTASAFAAYARFAG
jgi:hypothetical protein